MLMERLQLQIYQLCPWLCLWADPSLRVTNCAYGYPYGHAYG